METTQAAVPAPSAPSAPSALERRIEMAVPLADIDKEVAQRLKHIAKTTKMPGFRPGKVPMKMVEQSYGGQARSEAVGAAVERAFSEKVREDNLRVAGYPRIEPKNVANDTQFEFTAIFEVYPDVQLGDISAKEIEKATLVVTDAEVDKTIEVLRQQRTTFEPVERASAKGDRMVIDFVGRKNGEEFQGGKAENFTVEVGGGRMLPEFEAAIEGLAPAAQKTFDVKFPDDYNVPELNGQTVQFDVTVRAVQGPRLPELDADFAKALGIADGDLVKMRQEVKANLEREVKKRLQARIKNQVMDALLEVNPIDVPQALVEMESQQMAEAAKKDLESRGAAIKNMPVEPSWFTEQATRRVKLGLVLAELVKAKDLHAKPDQVKSIVEDFSETFEDPKEVVRWYYSQPQRLAEAEALAMENNVVDWALANAKVTEKAVGFDELMGNQA
ncbi:MAG: trigger factor [Gammaproteobacteria bacterium]|nr:trigger factor [Gammaproteobacteria bacterium]MBU1645466.1 trigger factor [Gammaproteobacteria bacterium]MBU1971089.1 trigger factor [Gammaproteobacteria bacterium]